MEDNWPDNISNPLVIVGACTETEAHTLGLDAILNEKAVGGYAGLAADPAFRVYNLGQVKHEEALEKTKEVGAQALLISQVATDKALIAANIGKLVALLEAEALRDSLLLICGGQAITPALARALGCDAGFGPHSRPQEVADFLIEAVACRRLGFKP